MRAESFERVQQSGVQAMVIRRVPRRLATIIDGLIFSDRYYIDRPMKVFYWIDDKFG